MKTIKKIRSLLLIFCCMFVITSCSSEPKEVKESRRIIEKSFDELKKGEIFEALKTMDPNFEEDFEKGLSEGYYAQLYLFEKTIENSEEVLKDFMKGAELKYEGFEYYEDDDSYNLMYTYKGKDIEPLSTAIAQMIGQNLLDSSLPDIIGELIEISNNPSFIDGSITSSIIRDAGNTYIDMNKVHFEDLEDVKLEERFLIYTDENGNLIIK